MTSQTHYKQQPQRKPQQPQPMKVITPNLDTHEYWDEATEKACLGSVLTNTNHYYKVSRIIDDGKAFYLLRHQKIWAVIKDMIEHELAVDMTTLSYKLIDTYGNQGFGDLGGPAYLTQLISETPTARHSETYARLVQTLYYKRKLLKLTEDIQTEIKKHDNDVTFERVLSRIITTANNTMKDVSSSVIITMAERGHDHLDASEKALQNNEVIKGIDTGIPALRELIGNLYPGTLILGARRHNGKTITLQTIALNAALEKLSVLYCNVADGDEYKLLASFYGMDSGLPPEMIRRRSWNPQQYSKYVDSVNKLSRCKLFIEHKIGMNPREMWVKANIIQNSHGLDLIVVDYIQRVGIPKDVQYTNTKDKIDYASNAMNEIASHFNVPVLYGAQLLRQPNPETDKPRLDQAKGSGNLEEDADVGITLWQKNPSVPEIIMSVEKNRETHYKGQSTTGFSDTTGRVGYNYNNQ